MIVSYRPPSKELDACMLVCVDSVYTLEIIAHILREVVNRERLCGPCLLGPTIVVVVLLIVHTL